MNAFVNHLIIITVAELADKPIKSAAFPVMLSPLICVNQAPWESNCKPQIFNCTSLSTYNPFIEICLRAFLLVSETHKLARQHSHE